MGDLVTLNFRNSGVVASARDIRGRFVSAQSEVRDAHTRMAIRLQEMQRDALQKSVDETARPQRDSKILLEALVNEGNRSVSVDGFIVGIPSFLDSTKAAPYYRHLEEGYSGFVGRELRGFFRTGESISGPSKSRRDVELIQMSGVVGDKQGNRASTSSLVDKNGNIRVRRSSRSGDQVSHGGGYRILIGRPIPAYRYIERGIQEWESSGIELTEYKRALAQFGDLLRWGGGANVGRRSGLR